MSLREIKSHFAHSIRALELAAEELSTTIDQCCEVMVEALRVGNKILIMGNGGSAADAQHFAAELVGRFLLERRALPAIALSTDTSILTAVGNDYGFDEVFNRQVAALAQPGDVVVGISTSGNSPNVLKALRTAKDLGANSVGLLGKDGGAIGGMVDINLTVRVSGTPFVQEAHAAIIHILCDQIEKRLFQG
jgi:D-sedoheptulose 7-phosphate isomerase